MPIWSLSFNEMLGERVESLGGKYLFVAFCNSRYSMVRSCTLDREPNLVMSPQNLVSSALWAKAFRGELQSRPRVQLPIDLHASI